MSKRRQTNDPIAVVDLFAGPGGLGEGFDRFADDRGIRRFDVRLSIEKDPHAYSTLLLRTFFRQFAEGKVPNEYYQYVRGEIDRASLFSSYQKEADQARQKVWHAKLGGSGLKHSIVQQRISQRLNGAKNWVLLGGPPCQAYSVVGRSRMRNTDKDAYESDHRHFLYKEYLRIIANHVPAAFVIENVKGLLSSVVKGQRTFERILQDLQEPARIFPTPSNSKLRYRLFPFSASKDLWDEFRQQDYVIRAEQYGIPQARHRILVLGVRSDVIQGGLPYTLSNGADAPAVNDAICDLPRLRSSISKPNRQAHDWFDWLQDSLRSQWFNEPAVTRETRLEIRKTLAILDKNLSTGTPFIPSGRKVVRFARNWFKDPQLGGFCNHEARGHMPSDLHRYLFAACFAKAHGRSPKLRDFPKLLLPDHKNVQEDVSKTIFSDRFRVQVGSRVATTITSHISRDGHYFIHPDASQCRSLTVREAARLQTFPDNYLFEGPTTEQYTQVGNAVPPLLALQLASVVHRLFA